MCCPPNFSEGVEASFVLRAGRSLTESPALRLPIAPDAAASTASHPASVTIAIRPSEGGTAAVLNLIWVDRKGEYFCEQDWTEQIALKAFEKIVQAQIRFRQLDRVEWNVLSAHCRRIGFTEWPHENQMPTKFRG
jgi:hypothetical protein